MKSFKDLREELNASLDEISKDLMRKYFDKATASQNKAARARDGAQKQATISKHSNTINKRNKGKASVLKRDFARKSGQDYAASSTRTDAIMRGDKGVSMTTKRPDQLNKNYKDR